MSVDLADPRAAVGEVVAGRYRIVSLLGRGGCGVVYRADDAESATSVALKILLVSDGHHPAARARFEREADLARRLTHPNTVRMLDFGIHEETPFIAWELLKGCGLDDVILEAPLGAARVARIAGEMLGSLAEAHELGIIHRDVKPANVFLCAADGRPEITKLLDFGIAKVLAPDSQAPHVPLTRRGEVPGTPRYMAPEQLSAVSLTPAVDIYAVGLVMAEALTGRRVFDDESGLDVLRRLVSSDPTPLAREVQTSPLAPIIERATRKAPTERYATANEMRAAVELVGRALAKTQAVSRTTEIPPDTVMPTTEMAPTDRLKSEPTVMDVVTAASSDPAPVDPPVSQPPGSPVRAPSDSSVSSPSSQPPSERAARPSEPVPLSAVAHGVAASQPTRETLPDLSAPSPRPLKWAVPAIVVLGALVAGLVVTVLVLLAPDAPESHAATRTATGRSPTSPGPTSQPSFGSSRALRSTAALVAALSSEGWSASPMPPRTSAGVTSTIVSITKDAKGGAVLMMHYADEVSASSMERVNGVGDMACKHAGLDAVCVTVDHDPRGSRELLATLLR